MVEVARASNGKFAPRIAQAPNGIDGSATGDVSSAPGLDGGSPETIINPAEIDAGRSAASESAAGKRGRGRPPGGGKKEETKRAETPGKLDLDSLNFTLFFAHQLLANATKTPEIALDELEAKRMAMAAMNVMQHYNIKASQKAIDWGNLVLTMGIVYGGKFHAINQRLQAEKQQARVEKESQIQNFGLA